MKKPVIAQLLIAATTAVLIANAERKPPSLTQSASVGPIAWMDSLEAAKRTAAREQKLLFVDFSAAWCGPCQQMLRTTYRDERVTARMKSFVPVLIDVDKQPALAQKYDVSAIPAAVFLDAEGNVVQRAVGYHDAASFLKVADAALKKDSGK